MENRRGMMKTLENPCGDLLLGLSGKEIREHREEKIMKEIIEVKCLELQDRIGPT